MKKSGKKIPVERNNVKLSVFLWFSDILPFWTNVFPYFSFYTSTLTSFTRFGTKLENLKICRCFTLFEKFQGDFHQFWREKTGKKYAYLFQVEKKFELFVKIFTLGYWTFSFWKGRVFYLKCLVFEQYGPGKAKESTMYFINKWYPQKSQVLELLLMINTKTIGSTLRRYDWI